MRFYQKRSQNLRENSKKKLILAFGENKSWNYFAIEVGAEAGSIRDKSLGTFNSIFKLHGGITIEKEFHSHGYYILEPPYRYLAK